MATTDLAITKPDVPAIVAEEYEELHAFSTKRLREELARTLHLSAAYLRRLAVIVRLLEERGEDLSDLKLDLLPYLRLIAHGQLLPELLVQHGHSPLLIRMARALPIPDQARLASGEPVPLAIRQRDGTIDHRMVNPSYLTREQMTLVFSMGRIRPIEEQIVVLEARGRAQEPRLETPRGAVRPDLKRGGIVVGRTFVPVADVVQALAALRGPEESKEENTGPDHTIPIKLSDAEHERLQMAAVRGRTKMTPLIRRALIAYGLI